MDNNELRELTNKLLLVRTRLVSTHPFFGRLLLHLQLGYADCETAFTDMKRIVFDPNFAKRLNDEELRFIFLHEVMHCVLHHCTRGRELKPRLYNIACDIVVNSLILEMLGTDNFRIDDFDVMHLVPDGREGRLFNAEEVYEMLIKLSDKKISSCYDEKETDTHVVWSQIVNALAEDEWDQYVKESANKLSGMSGMPCSIQRYIKSILHMPRMNWRQLLHDFIQYDRSDYTYQTPDRRFQGDVIMPSFQENIYGEKVEKLWFLIDTSGSISDAGLAEAFEEIKDALEQIDNLSGELSFFDCAVSKPIEFDSVEKLSEIIPVGGGGTSFEVIFESMEKYYGDEPPKAIIILTDGYADFPDEEVRKDVPVMWIIIDSDVDAPWGECIHIESY